MSTITEALQKLTESPEETDYTIDDVIQGLNYIGSGEMQGNPRLIADALQDREPGVAAFLNDLSDALGGYDEDDEEDEEEDEDHEDEDEDEDDFGDEEDHEEDEDDFDEKKTK